MGTAGAYDREMTVTAQFCPNCGAPLALVGNQCKFCHVPLVVSGASPAPAAPQVPGSPAADPAAPFSMAVEDVFSIAKRGTVVTGRISSGTIRVGDNVAIHGAGGVRSTTCTGVEMFRKQLDTATTGDNVGLLLKDIDKGDIARGDWVLHA